MTPFSLLPSRQKKEWMSRAWMDPLAIDVGFGITEMDLKRIAESLYYKSAKPVEIVG